PSAQEAEKATPMVRAAANPALEPLRRADPLARWAVTGSGALAYDTSQYGVADGQRAEALVLPLTLAILIVAFGALAAAGIPLALGLLATAATMGGVAIVGAFQPLSIAVQNVATMLGLALGIDYALLVVGRFREALASGLGVEDALAASMRTAGAAVVCSGLTVMIGLAGLAATPSLNVRSIGLGGGLVVLVGVGLALTLLPALLAVLGPRVDAPAGLRRHLAKLEAVNHWEAWSAWVCRHPLPLAAAGLLILATMCAPLAGLKTDFADADLLARHDLEFQRGMDLLAGMGRGNAGAPVLVLATAATPILDPLTMPALQALERQLGQDPRVQEVLGPVPANLDGAKFARKWRALRALAPAKFGAVLSADEKSALLTVVPDGRLRFEEVQALARDLGKAAAPGLTVEIGGQAALYNDVHYALMGSLPWLLAFVLGATFVVLALAYRSWLVPLKAIALNMLSVAAGYGALVVLFQWGWGGHFLGLEHGTGALPPAILATIFGIVFGLSMDYEVFLLARIKEGFDATHDNARAVREGLAATGGVITSAALIMVTVFGGFAGVHLIMVKMLGVGLAIAVFVDATIVRVLLAPAIMTLAGDWNWHPGYKSGDDPAKGTSA
ncbi:MAG: hypothetical protein JWM80_2603, partial [Cyanobacteria bacterium RYN_339]|nr:hypothetical protein [Cyanobacteria bacterium RYN_339]